MAAKSPLGPQLALVRPHGLTAVRLLPGSLRTGTARWQIAGFDPERTYRPALAQRSGGTSRATPTNATAVPPSPACGGMMARFAMSQLNSCRMRFSVATTHRAVALATLADVPILIVHVSAAEERRDRNRPSDSKLRPNRLPSTRLVAGSPSA